MLYLASRSPRRRALLARLGVPFAVLDVGVAEIRAAGESAQDYVCRVAREKARAGLHALGGSPAALVLGADTEVVLDGEVFGKPQGADDAAAMLRRLSGRTHAVLTAVTLTSAGREASALARSEVRFAELDEATIARYVESGEPMDKAGAYAIQGIAECFIEHLAGSHSGVMGLPLHETARLLGRFGIDIGGAPMAATAAEGAG